MTCPDYFITFDQYKDKSLSEFGEVLRRMPKKAIGLVQVSELCSMAEYPHGLYLFFDAEDVLWYVGRCTSRSFIERVPSYFDTRQRPDAWFNTVPTYIQSFCQIENYSDALALGLSLRLVLIGVKRKETTLKLEGVLRTYLQPKLNTGKKVGITGKELLSSCEI